MKTKEQNNQLNFNKAENQHRCIYRQPMPIKDAFTYRPIILQYFIHNRNYGWVYYHNTVINLNIKVQAEAFISTLISEGFLKSSKHGYTILDSHYHGFINVPKHQLLFYLYYNKATPLTEAECFVQDQLLQASL